MNNWGQFESVGVQAAGREATVPYRFRNGRHVEFSARKIDIEKMLADAKKQLTTSRVRHRRHQQPHFDGIPVVGQADPIRTGPAAEGPIPGQILAQFGGGFNRWSDPCRYRYIEYSDLLANIKPYLAAKDVAWGLDLEPREGHLDRRIAVTTPIRDPGAYLLTAELADGNTSRIILWLSELAILSKRVGAQECFFVADATTGAPVPGAEVELFLADPRRGSKGRIREVTKTTDANGLVMLDEEENRIGVRSATVFVTARTEDGRFALQCEARTPGALYAESLEPAEELAFRDYDRTKVYAMTDRPVYRPGHTAHFKVWIRRVRHRRQDRSYYAYRHFTLTVKDPKGEKVYEKRLQADAYGGLEGRFELDDDAALGVYRMSLDGNFPAWYDEPIGPYGAFYPSDRDSIETGTTFRVEEYKKPEFEVEVDAPKDPVTLGRKIKATVRATYYFGEPVREAMVKYTVTRRPHRANTYPADPWDWLYGPGYWWCGYDYTWFPDWRRWRTRRPISWSVPIAPTPTDDPPELVLRKESPIGPDGTLEIEIDTLAAESTDPDRDHRYSITAEVVDRSRRTRSSARATCSWPASRSRPAWPSIGASTRQATRSRPASRPREPTANRSRERSCCGCCGPSIATANSTNGRWRAGNWRSARTVGARRSSNQRAAGNIAWTAR